ncbi:hypothetical protein B566_EDAN018012 [Ephemera danica]|nr:hypothetical protein B566_EDAN018012 [Ephemera danica]
MATATAISTQPRRERDEYNYRDHGVKSYHDLVLLVDPVIIELKHGRNVLIIGHQAILWCICVYLMSHLSAELQYHRIQLHTLFSLMPSA